MQRASELLRNNLHTSINAKQLFVQQDEQIANFERAADALIPNILKALEVCREKNIISIVFCGRDGGAAKRMADHCIVVPGAMASTIQEIHIVLAHSVCECIERAILVNDRISRRQQQ